MGSTRRTYIEGGDEERVVIRSERVGLRIDHTRTTQGSLYDQIHFMIRFTSRLGSHQCNGYDGQGQRGGEGVSIIKSHITDLHRF